MAEKTSKSVHVFQHEVTSEVDTRDPEIALGSQKSWHGDNTIPEIEEWDSEVELKGAGIKGWIMNGLFLIFPAVFLALSIYLAIMNGQPVHTAATDLATVIKEDVIYYGLTQSLKIAVTIYPIIFGIILCKLLKTIVNYKAERGTHLITLEQIMASKSFGSALTAPLSFKGVNVTTAVLFLIWATSPITSQALQRTFSVGTATFEHENKTVTYLNLLNEAPSVFQGTLGVYPYYETGVIEHIDFKNDSTLPTADVSAATAFQSIIKGQSAAAKASGIDVFGFPKIPLLSTVEQDFEQDKDGWYDVGLASFWPFSWGRSFLNKLTTIRVGNTDWASLTGQPVLYVPQNMTHYSTVGIFNITTGYWWLNCSDLIPQWEADLGPAAEWHTNAKGPLQQETLDYPTWGSATLGQVGAHLTLGMKLVVPPGADGNTFPDLKIASKTWNIERGPGFFEFATTTCKWRRQVVDVEFGCVGGKCAASRMRPSSYSHGPPYDTDINSSAGFTHFGSVANMTRYFIHSILSASAVKVEDHHNPYGAGSSMLEQWLKSEQPMNTDSGSSAVGSASSVNLLGVSAEDFSRRLSQAFNAYWAVSTSPTTFSMMSSDGANTLEAVIGATPDFVEFMNTTASIDHQRPVYQCHWGWLVVILVSCVLLIFVIILNAVLESMTLTPDILGYVSSLTFNNRYIPLPAGGSTIAALDRSRKLAGLRVRVQDVKPDASIGHVALSTVDGARLKKGRKYH